MIVTIFGKPDPVNISISVLYEMVKLGKMTREEALSELVKEKRNKQYRKKGRR